MEELKRHYGIINRIQDDITDLEEMDSEDIVLSNVGTVS